MSIDAENGVPNTADSGGTGHHWVSHTELRALRQKLREAQETLEAIQSGDVDAVVVSGDQGSQIYTLSGAEEPYRIFLERMQEGAVTLSESGLILFSNQKFAEFAGEALEKVIGSSLDEYLPADACRELLDTVDSKEGAKIESEMQGLHRTIPVVLTASKIVTVESPVVCLVVTDQSGRRERRELAKDRDEARAANQSKDSFLAVLSHELRTPLTPALMAASLLERDPSLSDHGRELATMIRRNVEIETRLIDDLLDLTRITQGKIQLLKETVDLHKTIRDAIAVCAPELEDQAQQVELNLLAQTHHIEGDPVRLQQILWNLIRNASKFSSRRAKIFITSENIGTRKIRITVRDEGVGIDPAILPRLFNPFEQGGEDITKRFGGLGLGLVISKSIAEMHTGGSIHAQSPGKDQGSSFIITLETTEESDKSKIGRSSKGRLLLVEDNADSRLAVSLLMEGRGFFVVAVSTIADAFIALQNDSFDVLLSDIGLPDGSGHELMRHAKKQYGMVGVAMSGFGQSDDVALAKDAGFLLHLTKPVHASALESAVELAMESKI